MLWCTYYRYKIKLQYHKKHWIVEGSEYGSGSLLILVFGVFGVLQHLEDQGDEVEEGEDVFIGVEIDVAVTALQHPPRVVDDVAREDECDEWHVRDEQDLTAIAKCNDANDQETKKCD